MKKKTYRASDDPVFARDKLGRAHRHVHDLKGLDGGVALVIPNVHAAIVKGEHDPWLGGMQIRTFHSVGSRSELPLDIQSERLREKVSLYTMKTRISLAQQTKPHFEFATNIFCRKKSWKEHKKKFKAIFHPFAAKQWG